MARYAVTFRIHSDATYTERYTSFCDKVREGAAKWWAGTTAFYAIQSNEALDAFCSRIYLHSKFDASKDLFVVINVETGAGRVKGKVTDRDLFAAFPGVTQI